MFRSRFAALMFIVTLGAAVAAASCGSDDDSSGPADGDGGSISVDNCTLLTDEEVSAFAGDDLRHSEDSPIGCAYTEPGETLGMFSIRSYRTDGDATAAAQALAPSLRVIPLSGVGEDAVALADSDDSVNFVIARSGDLFVELVMTFLDVTPESSSLQKAGQLASTALGRLVEAA
jgi:hypothetical protein